MQGTGSLSQLTTTTFSGFLYCYGEYVDIKLGDFFNGSWPLMLKDLIISAEVHVGVLLLDFSGLYYKSFPCHLQLTKPDIYETFLVLVTFKKDFFINAL